MEAEDPSDSSHNSFDEQDFLKEILQEPDFSQETEHPSTNSISNTQNDTVVEGGANSPTNSGVSFDEITSASGTIGTTMHKSNKSSNFGISLENKCISSKATYFLSFDNSSVERIVNEPDYPKEISATESKKRRKWESGFEFEVKVNQPNRKVRGSRESKDHIMAERRRRLELTGNIIALSATIPGLKKMDKAYVLREAVNYTKQLQERIKELENQNRDTKIDSTIFVKKYSQPSLNIKTASTESVLIEIEARELEKEILIGIHCEKQKDIMLKIYTTLEKLHLSLTSSSVLPFGTSIIVINILAQMEDEYNMTVDELVRNLRQNIEARD